MSFSAVNWSVKLLIVFCMAAIIAAICVNRQFSSVAEIFCGLFGFGDISKICVREKPGGKLEGRWRVGVGDAPRVVPGDVPHDTGIGSSKGAGCTGIGDGTGSPCA